mmetsp:Transcript_1252/g.2842  ORF Transcript_1252/g.2842 Transcript_1252/m.2842 type:complete len:206 (+) Transcript_1252:3524-4141(+)
MRQHHVAQEPQGHGGGRPGGVAGLWVCRRGEGVVSDEVRRDPIRDAGRREEGRVEDPGCVRYGRRLRHEDVEGFLGLRGFSYQSIEVFRTTLPPKAAVRRVFCAPKITGAGRAAPKNGSGSTDARRPRRALEALRQGDLHGRLQTEHRGAARAGRRECGRRSFRERQAEEEVGRPALLLHGRRRRSRARRRRLVRQVHGDHRASA